MSIEEISIYILSAVVTILIIWVTRLEISLRNLPKFEENKDINNQLASLKAKTSDIYKISEKIIEHFKIIDKKTDESIRNVETIRFNPFKKDGVGGNQSFATTFINEEGDGVIISSLYSRERISVFAKPIKNWGAEYELSEEEKEVLQKTKNKYA